MEKYIIAVEAKTQKPGIEYHCNSIIEASSQDEAIKTAKELFGDRILSFNRYYDPEAMKDFYAHVLLAKYTWEEIKNTIKSGKGSIFKLGDSKTIELANGEVHEAVLVHYENDKAIFQFRDAISEEYSMNDECTNEGGWAKSKMANKIMPMLFSMLPADLQNVIEKINVDGINCHLFLPSEKELFGKRIRGIEDDSKQFDYYKDIRNLNKLIKCDSETGYTNAWCWTRTPSSDNTHNFVVWIGCSYGYYGAYNYLAVAPCFAL